MIEYNRYTPALCYFTRAARVGMKKDEALKVLWDNVRSGGICGDVVRVLEKNYDEVNRARETASATEGKRYYESVSGENGKAQN